MKNYREMAEDVLRRAEEEKQKTRRRRRRALGIGLPVLAGLLALALLLWPKSGAERKGAPAEEPSRESALQHLEASTGPGAALPLDTVPASDSQPEAGPGSEPDSETPPGTDPVPPEETRNDPLPPEGEPVSALYGSVDELAAGVRAALQAKPSNEAERRLRLDELTTFCAPVESAFPGYRLGLIEVNAYSVFYYLKPEEDPRNKVSSDWITVTCSREEAMSLDTLSAQLGIGIDENDVLYDPVRRYLFFTADGVVMSLMVPEQLNQYDRLLSMRAVERVTVRPDQAEPERVRLEPEMPAGTRLAALLEGLRLPAQELADPVFGADREEPVMTEADLVRAVNANPTVAGTVTALDTVRVESADGTVWYLASMTVAVREVLTGTAPAEVCVVCAGAYNGTDADTGMVPIPQLAGCREGVEAVFVLRTVDEGVWTIDGKAVNPADLGDYTVVYRLEQEGDRLSYPAQSLSVLCVPTVKLSASGEDGPAEMIGLVVWKGAVYTMAGIYVGEDAEAIRGLLGEHLGRASGTIDEWSGQDEYAVDLASTVLGEVYTVIGYDPDFRLCVVSEQENEAGEPELWIGMMERFKGVALAKGADLFTDRLRTDGRVTGLRYQTHDDWNDARYLYHPLEHTEAVDAFLKALNEGAWTYQMDSDPDLYRGQRRQAHLWLDLEDGTAVELRLLEGGLAGYQALSWYYVELPPEVFDPIFEQCQ